MKRLFEFFRFFYECRYLSIFTLLVSFFFIGILLFLIQRNLLVVCWVCPSLYEQNLVVDSKKQIAPTKKISFYYWKDDVLRSEERSVVWRSNKADNLKVLIGNWLMFLYEERILDKRVSVESVALTEFKQDAYLSFDQSPFQREWSIYKKRQFLDAFGKTLEFAEVAIQSIQFLVGQQLCSDDHLDFSQPWFVNSWDG